MTDEIKQITLADEVFETNVLVDFITKDLKQSLLP